MPDTLFSIQIVFGEMKYESKLPPATKDQITALQKNWNLPEDYIRFLEIHNGGRPEQNMFNIHSGNNTSVKLFWGVGGNTNTGIDHYIALSANTFPKGFLPIGTDPGANFILLNTNKEDFGSIHLHDRMGGGKIYRVADSFTGFLKQTNWLSC